MDKQFWDFSNAYESRTIKIKLKDGSNIIGYVDAVIPAEDIDDNKNLLVLNIDGTEKEIFLEQITKVEIIQDK